MQISFLDAKTLGNLPEISDLNKLGNTSIYPTTSSVETAARIKDCEIVITNKVILNEEVLSKAPKLKLICIAATGMNNVDLHYCKQHEIIVKNAVGYSTNSVAQFTFNSLLYFLHKTHYYDQYVKSGEYISSDIFTHIHHDFSEISGMNFGIIGLGNIGQAVAKLAEAFGAKVFYYSTSGRNNNESYTRISLDELLNSCDVISIHSPLNNKTENLIAENELKKMKSNAILINMGRGGIVKEAALAKALDNQWIGGAITDVLTVEPITKENPLFHLKEKDRLLITPHIAWASLEARKKLLDIVTQHILDYKNGRITDQ